MYIFSKTSVKKILKRLERLDGHVLKGIKLSYKFSSSDITLLVKYIYDKVRFKKSQLLQDLKIE